MIKYRKFYYLIALFTFIYLSPVKSQKVIITPDSRTYEKMKKEGKIDKDVVIVQPGAETIKYDKSAWEERSEKSMRGGSTPSLACQCMQDVDSSYLIAPFTNGIPPEYRNDDGSTALIQLPFTFCLYGNSYNDVYINNNGNISFGSSYGTFTSSGFPSNQYVMVAPFWADVDTRNPASGLVYYKITPTYMIVRWETVGYYSQQTDKLNDFQLVITDGTDPILPPGMNINFCYGDMQWTTGSASGGINGFAGTPATVGANKGDGIDYIQMGRFDQPGAFYDGPFNLSDGIDWLDGQSMFFNVCSSQNIAPIVSGISICDTIKVCGNDTLVIQPLFLSPEQSQTTSITVSPSAAPGVTILNSAPGNTATTTIQIVAAQANPGNNTFVITGTDNGVPVQSSVVTLNIFIDTTGLAALNPVISGNTVICVGNSTTLSVPAIYDSYLWSNGSTSPTANYSTQGPVWVTVTSAGCTGSQLVNITPPANVPLPIITGDSLICPNATTVLTLANAGAYSSFFWPDLSTNTTYTVGIGNYTVTATDPSNCTVTANFTVNPDTVNVPDVNIVGNLTVCTGGQTTIGFSTTDSLSSFAWSNGATTPQITVSAGSFNLSVTDTSGCSSNVPFSVSVDPALDPNPLIAGILTVCTGGQTQLDLQNSPLYQSITWNNGSNAASITVGVGVYGLVATDTNGCSGTSNIQVVTEDPALNPTPVITGFSQVCNGGTTQLYTDSAYVSYIWSNASINDTVTVSLGTYTVTVTDADGCTGTSPPLLVTDFTPTVDITGNLPFCPEDFIYLTAVPNISSSVSYLWSSSDTGATVSITGTGLVSVISMYPNGCEAYDTIALVNYAIPDASFTVDPPSPSPSGTAINFTSTSTIAGGATVTGFLWNFGDGGSGSIAITSHSYNMDSTYTVLLTVTSSDGCTDTVSMSYQIISEIEFPNIITPNSDGKNDKLAFKNLQYKTGTSLSVLNRWGNKVYESSDYKNDWEPDLSAGVYYYILTIKDEPKPHTGYFHIQR